MREEKRQPLFRYHRQQLYDEPEFDDLQERACRRPRLEEEKEVNENVKREDVDEVIEQNMPFCCAVCHCSEARKKATILEATNDTFIGFNLSHFHRLCCHNGNQKIAAKELSENIVLDEESDDDSYALFNAKDVQKYITNANRQETMYFNTDKLEVEADKLLSNEDYVQHVVKDFHVRTRRKMKDGLIVLDLFGGVGTALVVLKRLKIPIKKIIHVEHDLVATFVNRMNHDNAFVESLREFARNKKAEGEDGGYVKLADWAIPDDGIEHVYYRRFEDIFDASKTKTNAAFQAFLKTHVQTGKSRVFFLFYVLSQSLIVFILFVARGNRFGDRRPSMCRLQWRKCPPTRHGGRTRAVLVVDRPALSRNSTSSISKSVYNDRECCNFELKGTEQDHEGIWV